MESSKLTPNTLSKQMTVSALKTPVFKSGENLAEFIFEACINISVAENSVLAVTSKIVSLSENRTVAQSKSKKIDLVKKEADYFLGEIAHNCFLTINHSLLIPSAGIDESNSSDGSYILFPENPFQSADLLLQKLKKLWNLKNLGIIFTDSHTTPLRRGVTGIALAYAGIKGVRELAGTPDIFNRNLVFTAINNVDALASAATLLMGEGNDCCPLAVINHAPVEFIDYVVDPTEVQIPLENDLYYPIIKDRL